MSQAKLFRKLLQTPEIIVAPGVYDAIGARIVQQCGFQAVYMTGNGAMASLLGKPDLGLATMTEMVGRAHQLATCVDIPLICDADTGYGGLANVRRAVREFESAGVAAIHIEDQTCPKRCGALGGITVVSEQEACARIEAGVNARKDDDFSIIARTDARGVQGLDAAIRRVKLFEKAGADAVMVEILQDIEEVKAITAAADVPVLYNIYEDTREHAYSVGELERAGVKIVINCLTATLFASHHLQRLLASFKETGTTNTFYDEMMPMNEYTQMLGIDQEIDL